MESNSLVETLCVFCGTTVAQTDVYDLCTHCRSAIDYVCDSEDEIIRLIRYRRQWRSGNDERKISIRDGSDDR